MLASLVAAVFPVQTDDDKKRLELAIAAIAKPSSNGSARFDSDGVAIPPAPKTYQAQRAIFEAAIRKAEVEGKNNQGAIDRHGKDVLALEAKIESAKIITVQLERARLDKEDALAKAKLALSEFLAQPEQARGSQPTVEVHMPKVPSAAELVAEAQARITEDAVDMGMDCDDEPWSEDMDLEEVSAQSIAAAEANLAEFNRQAANHAEEMVKKRADIAKSSRQLKRLIKTKESATNAHALLESTQAAAAGFASLASDAGDGLPG
jgi:hypothetical protein